MINEQQRAEVRWYCKHGAHPKARIVMDNRGQPYVIGDRCWNVRGKPPEYVEHLMPKVALPHRAGR